MRAIGPATLLAIAAGLAGGSAAAADKVALAGSMGQRALLVIDGAAPRAVAVGATLDGVKVLSVSPTEAVVEVDGQRRTLLLGASQLDVGRGGKGAAGRRIVLSAEQGGHFFATGTINGQTVRFVVDTGATYIALDQALATRIGLRLNPASRLNMHTANGTVPAHRVSLGSVRIGDVELHNVEAVVLPQAMPVVLLGNSFLTRFKMQRENDQLTLDRSY
ncbi:retropepsin-like aspartic protease family protein [Caldimonas tepidiphila]|uniref:retropepsin-like aspartic protease family protein n=1 Tax=Caldimonas tepidiphila TaxID=2315841 RepID=UPI000E5A1FC7|nr:retropepsin-like aspartic protease [Caldimonas tepidiphila]